MQCHLLASLLRHHGVKVLTAPDGEQAFQLLREIGSVHAVVINWDEPENSGRQFCDWLNNPSSEGIRGTPILAVSAQFDQEQTKELTKAGVQATLTLPVHPQRFLTVIDQLIHQRSKRRPPRVLIASPLTNQFASLCRGFQDIGWRAHVTTVGVETRQMLKELCPDLVVMEDPFSDGVGMGLVDHIKSHHPEMAVFLVCNHDDPSLFLEALQHGVDEIIRPPLTAQYVFALWVKYQKLRDRAFGEIPRHETSTFGAPDDQASIARVAGEIAHDVNNVLTSILGHAGLLNQRPAAKNSVLESARVIEQAARRGKELTDHLLGAVKPQRERRESVNLVDIVQEVLDLLQPEQNFAIRVERGFYAGDNWVKGDAGKLHQIILNLILNACEAMPQGGTLSVETHMKVVNVDSDWSSKSVLPGRYLELTVRDTGCGIPADVLPHVFEVFFTTKSQGSGIGLATVRDVVQQYGGTVTVDSQVGCGTTFHVLLPQVAGERRSAETRIFERETTHVLVVDDDQDVGRTTAELLDFLGYEVTVVDKGTSAIDLVRSQPDLIDVVLLDMTMSPMDGPTCFRSLHKLNPTMPIILSSGIDHNPDVQHLFDEGLAGFVQKPYDIQKLETVMEKANQGYFPHLLGKVSSPAPVAEDIV